MKTLIIKIEKLNSTISFSHWVILNDKYFFSYYSKNESSFYYLNKIFFQIFRSKKYAIFHLKNPIIFIASIAKYRLQFGSIKIERLNKPYKSNHLRFITDYINN